MSGGDTDGEDLGEESGIDGEGEEGAVDVEITDDATPEGGGDEGSEESEYPLPEPEQRHHASEENRDDLDSLEIAPDGGEEIPDGSDDGELSGGDTDGEDLGEEGGIDGEGEQTGGMEMEGGEGGTESESPIEADEAQLTNIELQNMLQKQQQLIQMLSNISKALEDNAMSDIRDLSSGGDSNPVDDPESGGQSTVRTTDPAIEAEAAALVEEVLAAKTPEDAAALVQSVLRESYMENNQDLAYHAHKVKFFNECKKQVRTHLADLRNTTNTISEGEDGTQIEEKAQDLNEADSRGGAEESESHYQLVEGRLLVGEAEVINPIGNTNDEKYDTEEGEEDEEEEAMQP